MAVKVKVDLPFNNLGKVPIRTKDLLLDVGVYPNTTKRLQP